MNITYFFFSLFGIILYGITFDPSSFLPLENFPNKRRGRRCNGHFIGLQSAAMPNLISFKCMSFFIEVQISKLFDWGRKPLWLKMHQRGLRRTARFARLMSLIFTKGESIHLGQESFFSLLYLPLEEHYFRSLKGVPRRVEMKAFKNLNLVAALKQYHQFA